MTVRPVVVIGASLAGMAAAARLAKLGHRVVLLEKTEQLGGRARSQLPDVVLLPAPWRDLFKKSGRAFDAELTRSGLALVDAPPARHVFADGTELWLPSERGAQFEALSASYGRAVAGRWRDLLDRLVDTWQALRPLGLETDDHSSDPLGTLRDSPGGLDPRRTVADLATGLGEPHLAEIVLDTARREGSDPAHTPALRATRLAVERTFGRWYLTAGDEPQPASRLVDLLADRLRLRKVDIRHHCEVDAVDVRHLVVRDNDGVSLDAAAIVCATDAAEQQRLLPPRRAWWARPRQPAGWALAPRVNTRLLDDALPFGETVTHTPAGPVVTWHRPQTDGRTAETVHDHAHGTLDPGLGPAWRGLRSWSARPTAGVAGEGVFLAGAQLRGGNQPEQIVLSGAIASHEVDGFLTTQPR